MIRLNSLLILLEFKASFAITESPSQYTSHIKHTSCFELIVAPRELRAGVFKFEQTLDVFNLIIRNCIELFSNYTHFDKILK